MTPVVLACAAVMQAIPTEEFHIISNAAVRNNCYGDNFWILLAIRKAEDGGPGREFGIMNPKADNLDKQAGWAAATIVKNRARWVKAGKPGDFIKFLGSKYAPIGAENDPTGLNANWVRNVSHWYKKFKGK